MFCHFFFINVSFVLVYCNKRNMQNGFGVKKKVFRKTESEVKKKNQR